MDILEKCPNCPRGYYAQAIGEFNCVICGYGPAPSLPWEPGPKPETDEQIEAALQELRRRCVKTNGEAAH
jgi:hypothetical protein